MMPDDNFGRGCRNAFLLALVIWGAMLSAYVEWVKGW